MQILEKDKANEFKELIENQANFTNAYSLIFYLSKIDKVYSNEFQSRIVINILNDLFRDENGYIFLSADNNIVLIVDDADPIKMDKCVYQLRYLFEDDQTLNSSKAQEEIYQIFYLKYQWKDFKKQALLIAGHDTSILNTNPYLTSDNTLNISKALTILGLLDDVELSQTIRSQAICAKPLNGSLKPIFYELYISYSHLSNLLNLDFDLRNEPIILSFLKKPLDKKFLELLKQRKTYYMNGSVSINLSVESIINGEFAEFDQSLEQSQKGMFVIELDYSDVLSNLPNFNKARQILQYSGYKILLDKLDHHNIFHINPKSLGFDLFKLYWSFELENDIELIYASLEERINDIGTNRIILANCDNKYALNYARTMGISIYQGFQVDKMLKPELV